MRRFIAVYFGGILGIFVLDVLCAFPKLRHLVRSLVLLLRFQCLYDIRICHTYFPNHVARCRFSGREGVGVIFASRGPLVVHAIGAVISPMRRCVWMIR